MKLFELKNQRAELLKNAEGFLNEGKVKEYDDAMKQVKDLNQDIERAQVLDIERGRFDDDDNDSVNAYKMINMQKEEKEEEKTLDGILGEKEYAKAFCNALRNGVSRSAVLSGRAPKAYSPLYNALTIKGTPDGGQDGGFLVPKDVSTKINELRRQLVSLADVVNVENVSTSEGSRPFDMRPTKGFTKIGGELQPVPTDDQPIFSQVSYKTEPYGLRLPLSKELVEDEDANLLSYIAGWFADKQIITENDIIISKLNELKAVDVKGKLFDAIKKALNVTLDPAISPQSRIITNQSGFNMLDVEKDTNGNYLLNNSLLNGTGLQALSNAISRISNANLPDAEGKTPMYLGDFRAYMTLFRRKNLELRATDVGGDAWKNNGYEFRAITRLGATVFDKEAAVKLNITSTPTA